MKTATFLYPSNGHNAQGAHKGSTGGPLMGRQSKVIHIVGPGVGMPGRLPCDVGTKGIVALSN